MSRGGRRVGSAAVALGLAGAVLLGTAGPAQAHPLGNFTVNHYNGLTLEPDRIDLHAVVDLAEIPTQQELPSIDADGDDVLDAAELASHAASECAELTAAATLEVGGAVVALGLGARSLETVPGAAGLPTLRLTCELSAEVDLANPATVRFADDYRGDRVGWHELTARGDGVRITESAVPSVSVSDELRAYPQDLLSSPLDDRSVTLRTEPGEGTSVSGPASTATSENPFTRLISWGDRTLQNSLADDLTPVVGGLAALLSILLGAGHALLPGHGKTVMAAYLAGRRGARRDAYKVGAIVTATHTASVLVLGLMITVSAAVVGEQALRYLGVVSGVLIALVGAMLLREAIRSRRAVAAVPVAVPARVHSHAVQAHDDDSQGGHSLDAGHSHDEHRHSHDEHVHSHDEHVHSHDEPAHSHEHEHSERHEHSHDHGHGASGWLQGGHHHSASGHGHSHATPGSASTRAGLVGMGIAGGLVPSPSALVVLLGSVALGRTVFGVLLVLLYGLGMAGTLTAVGLLLVKVRDRLERPGLSGRMGTRAARLAASLPVATAVLVLVVGLGLAVRGLRSPV